MLPLPAGYEKLTEHIIGCGIAVHREFGPGLIEPIYQPCLVIELQQAGLRVEENRRLELHYKGRRIGKHYWIDLIVEDTVLIELKAVAALAPIHQAQVITYLKLTGCPLGLLMNFNVPILTDGIRRVVHPQLYMKRTDERS